MSNDKRKSFYIANIEDDNIHNETDVEAEKAINDFFAKKNVKNLKSVEEDNQDKVEYSKDEPSLGIKNEKRPVNDDYQMEIKDSRKDNYFVSPMLGRQVDKNTDINGNLSGGAKRYDDYRKRQLLSPQEVKEKYGRNYREYGVFDSEQYREILETGKLTDRKVIIPPSIEEIINNDDSEELEDFTDFVPKKEEEQKYKYYQPRETKKVSVSDEIEDLIIDEPIPQEKTPSKPIEIPKKTPSKKKYQFPPLSILRMEVKKSDKGDEWLKKQSEIINQTFIDFSYGAEVAGWVKGPSVTQFFVSIKPGTNVNKIRAFEKDLLLKLSAKSIRIQDPIPGKNYAGIEIPNLERSNVYLGNLINNPKFLNDTHQLVAALGLDINGDEVYVDISKMPHGLIAGTTGSGKSVCINSIIISLLYRNTPEQLRLILVDPKMVELSSYDEIPHLAMPVITDPKRASSALRWATEEMDKRFSVFKTCHVRTIDGYNEYVGENGGSCMPSIVIIIDELADLMSVAASEVEGNIQRLTAKARAAGIHIIVATQRPSTDIIRGSIKNNISVRAAFRVASYTDSNTIIDHSGAEKLLGNGDMLFVDQYGERRLQGAFISDSEITKVTNFLRGFGPVNYLIDESDLDDKNVGYVSDDDIDELFNEIATYAVKNKTASINKIMQTFNISFNRANRLFIQLEELGIVSGTVKGKQREILVDEDELEEILHR